ncbi:MAG TPA: DJ-1/PfpI family protein [Phenylobacterium sp.]|nr:DJ-1/PfpI family protein [Phenylobacterium sp.]HKR89535.1 DJ-1/PfpI family protein [Phenylobacterium sp.]
MSRRLAMVVFPRFQILDATGPLAAFEIASRFVAGAYDVRLLAPRGGLVASSSGVAVAAETLDAGRYDTVMVAGGEGARAAEGLTGLTVWLRRQAKSARRIASVCSGAYVLAEAGLLDGRRATTHWGGLGALRAALSPGAARAGPHLCAGRAGLDLGRDHRRHRPGAGADRGGPG